MINQNLADIDKDDDESHDPFLATVPLRGWAVSFLIVMSYLPLAWLFRLCEFSFPPVDLMPKLIAKAIFQFFLYWGAVHVVLVVPLSMMAMTQISRWPQKFWRVIVITLLTLPPLAAYAYFRGGIKEIMDFNEIMLVVIPACVIGALGYDKCRIPLAFSLFLAVSTFFSFFIMNDILGTLPTVANYLSDGAAFYVCRQLTPVLGLFVGCFLLGRENMPRRNRSQETFFLSTLAFFVYAVVTHYVIPFIADLMAKGNEANHLSHDLGWLISGVACVFLYIKKPWMLKALLPLCFGYMALLAFQFVQAWRVEGGDYWKLGDIEYAAIGILLFGWLAKALWKFKPTRKPA